MNDVFVCSQSTNPYFTCGWRQWLRWTPSSSIKQDISLKVTEVEEDRKEKGKRRMKKNKSVKEKEWGDFFFSTECKVLMTPFMRTLTRKTRLIPPSDYLFTTTIIMHEYKTHEYLHNVVWLTCTCVSTATILCLLLWILQYTSATLVLQINYVPFTCFSHDWEVP